MEFKNQQENDIHPMDWDFETQLALEGLQVQVAKGNMSNQAADQYMRKIYGGFFYTVDELENPDL